MPFWSLYLKDIGFNSVQIGELLQTERIRPVIDKVFPFEQARQALDPTPQWVPGLGAVRGAGLALVDLLAPAKRFVARKMSFGANG